MPYDALPATHLDPDALLLLIRIHAPESSEPEALYEKVRKWWRMSRTQAERAKRVLAVVDGKVVEAYEPRQWLDAPLDEDKDRVGFVGTIAHDRETWVGRDVHHLFKPGAANPVRYLPASVLVTDEPAGPAAETDNLALLLRLNQSWYDGIPAQDLYEITRAWWVLSSTNAERVARVLAVAGGVVREVYEPTEWLPSPVPGMENRIGFNGTVAPDRETYVGRDVSHLFRPGSANPVRYLPLAALVTDTAVTDAAVTADDDAQPAVRIANESVEPGLLERVLPLLNAFEQDLLWAQSRAAQELFHSNTIAWLLRTFPQACLPLLNTFGAAEYQAADRFDVWREKKNLDILVDPVGAHPKVVVENKLYAVPYPAQLTKYNSYPLPWSDTHSEAGAPDTRYVLLSLMTPSFPLPKPWVHVNYRDVAEALDLIDADELSHTSDLFVRYRALVHRLVALAEAVAPAQALDEQFSAATTLAQLPGGGLDGAITRMRFSGLAQVIQTHFAETKAFEIGGARGGEITYFRRLSHNRQIGWQFQDNQLRFQITVEDPHLQGKSNRAAREEIVEADHLDFFDHSDVEAILGPDVKAKTYATGTWNAFNPDFVYRHRPVKSTVSTARLAEALAAMTRRVDEFADKTGYQPP